MIGGLTILFAAVAVLGGLIFAAAGKFRRDCLALRRAGIRANRQVKQLLLDLQQHRGMANAYLNGDGSFKARIEKKQAEIDRDIAALDDLLQRELITAQRWNAIKSDWQKLRGEVLSLQQEESFRRNSALIRAVLYSMGDVAERSQIAGGCNVDTGLIKALWSDIPVVAEGLGKARGLGSGVAAKGHCSGVARIKLRFLEERVGEIMKWVDDDFASRAATLDAALIQSWEGTHRTVSEFLALLERTLLESERPSIDAEHYFAAATKALDAVFLVFDQVSDALDNALGRP